MKLLGYPLFAKTLYSKEFTIVRLFYHYIQKQELIAVLLFPGELDPVPSAQPWLSVPTALIRHPSSELPSAPLSVRHSYTQWGGGGGTAFHQLLTTNCAVTRLPFAPQSLNEFLDSVGAPLEITDGFISSISVIIPWSALITENCTVEVTGLQVTCRPKYHF
eukprot:g39026.t1